MQNEKWKIKNGEWKMKRGELSVHGIMRFHFSFPIFNF